MARRVRIVDLIAEPLELELPDGVVAVVPEIGVEDVMRMSLFEAEIAGEGGDATDALIKTRDFVCDVIKRDNPDLFADGYPNWTPSVVMAVLAALAGDDSVAESIRKALVGDPDEQAAEAAVSEQEKAERESRGEADPEEAADSGDPLTSTKPSQPRSSNSDESSAGAPSGGANPDAPGASSEHTSETYAAAV